MQKNVDVAGTGFAARLRKLRSAANLTKADLAERSGVSFRTIHNYEKGHSRRVQEKTLRLLAAALDVTYEYLLTGQDPTPPPDTTATTPEAVSADTASVELPRPRRPRRILTALTVIGVVMVASYFALQVARTQNPLVEIDGNHILVRDDILKLKLWERRHDSAIEVSKVVEIAGRKELAYGLYGNHADSGRFFVCDAAKGRVLWETRPDVQEAMRAFGSIVSEDGGFGVSRVSTADIDGDGLPEIVVAYENTRWYPSFICIYRRDGSVVGSYYNGGHIYDIHATDIDDDGKDEILLGTTNNGKRYQGASLILLDDVFCHGASSDSLMMAQSDLPDSCAVRIILPQFDPPFMTLCGGVRGSSRLYADKIHTFVTATGETRLEFQVGIDESSLVVVADANLHPLSVSPSDAFLRVMAPWSEPDKQRFLDGLNGWLARAYRYGARP